MSCEGCVDIIFRRVVGTTFWKYAVFLGGRFQDSFLPVARKFCKRQDRRNGDRERNLGASKLMTDVDAHRSPDFWQNDLLMWFNHIDMILCASTSVIYFTHPSSVIYFTSTSPFHRPMFFARGVLCGQAWRRLKALLNSFLTAPRPSKMI